MSHSVETKEDNRTFKGGRNGKSHGKVCHICGEPGHFKKHCPQKQDKKHQKRRCNGKKNGKDNTEKIKGKLRKMIFKTNELKIKKENEIIILNEQTRKFQQLLDNSDNVDAKTLRNEIKNIAKSFKNGKKNTKIKNHKNKCNYNKQERKQERKLAKEKKRLAKEERKRLKKEKKEKSVPNTNISSEMNGFQHENEDEDEDTSSTDYEQVEGDNDNDDNAPDMNDHGDEFTFIFGRDGY